MICLVSAIAGAEAELIREANDLDQVAQRLFRQQLQAEIHAIPPLAMLALVSGVSWDRRIGVTAPVLALRTVTPGFPS